MNNAYSFGRALVALALAASSLGLARSAHAQESLIAPVSVTPGASVGFTSAGEQVTVRVLGPDAAPRGECRTPCVLTVSPGAHTLESGAPHPTRLATLLQPGPQTYEVRPHGPSYGVGLGLTISGGVLLGGSLVVTAGLTVAAGPYGLVFGGLFIGLPMAVLGTGLLVPGAIVLSSNGPARVERALTPGTASARRRRDRFGLASGFARDEQGAAYSTAGFTF